MTSLDKSIGFNFFNSEIVFWTIFIHSFFVFFCALRKTETGITWSQCCVIRFSLWSRTRPFSLINWYAARRERSWDYRINKKNWEELTEFVLFSPVLTLAQTWAKMRRAAGRSSSGCQWSGKRSRRRNTLERNEDEKMRSNLLWRIQSLLGRKSLSLPNGIHEINSSFSNRR